MRATTSTCLGAAPAYKKNDFGHTLGGPVFIPGVYNPERDKTFFFWSEEWRRERVPGDVPFNAQVPSAAERTGDFSDLCPNAVTGSDADCPSDPATGKPFPNNQVPVDLNAAFLVNLIPLPNGGRPGAETYIANPSFPTNRREDSIRLDQNFSPGCARCFGLPTTHGIRYLPSPFFGGGSFPTVRSELDVSGISLFARLNRDISKTTLNEFVFSYTTNHFQGTNVGNWQRPAGMTTGALFQNGFGGKLPGFGLSGSSAYNGGFGLDLGSAPWKNSNPTYTYRDNLSKIVSRHNLQMGAYFVAAQKNEPNFAPLQGSLNFDATSENSTGNPFADMLTGRISLFSNQSPGQVLQPVQNSLNHISRMIGAPPTD